MKLKRIAIAVAAILFASSIQAQVPPPVLQQASVFGSFYLGARSPDVSATTTSGTSAVALGTAAGVAYVCNTGSNNAYFRLGASTITVTAANGIPLIAGQCGNFYATGATHIVGITATSTATLQTAMGWGSAFAAGGGSGGGGGGGSVTQGTSPWVDNITQWASTALGAPSQFGTSPGAVNVPGVNAFVTNLTTNFVTATLNPWTSATAANATQAVMPISTAYGAAAIVQLNQTTTISAGAVTFEGTYDGTNWVTIPVAQVLNANTFSPLTNPYTLVASTNQPFLILTQGYQGIRAKLSTQITGSGTVTPYVALLPFLPVDPALLNPLATQSPTVDIGAVGISQTIPGTTNAVQPIAGATGGATLSSAIAPATPAGVNLKASAGTLYGLQCTTIQATPVFVKLYNSASAPTCGSGTPAGRWMCPSANTAANGAGNNPSIPAVGVAFPTGLGYCVTGGIADNDTTAITAANTLVNIEWK